MSIIVIDVIIVVLCDIVVVISITYVFVIVVVEEFCFSVPEPAACLSDLPPTGGYAQRSRSLVSK